METHDDQQELERRRFRSRVVWWALLIGSLLVFEATSQPAFAAAVTCAKFGWPDFRIALWLLRVDPVARRGNTCFWFYLAYGLWKISFMSIVMSIFLVLMAVIVDAVWGVPVAVQPMLVGVMLAAFFGFGLSFVTTYIALISAVMNGVKVWLGSAPHRARAGRYWPPRHGRINGATPVAVVTFLTTCLFMLLTLPALAEAGRMGMLPFVIMAVVSSLMFLAFVFLIWVLCSGVFALSPEDCWRASTEEHVYEAAAHELASAESLESS
jgi:hypothetical protein